MPTLQKAPSRSTTDTVAFTLKASGRWAITGAKPHSGQGTFVFRFEGLQKGLMFVLHPDPPPPPPVPRDPSCVIEARGDWELAPGGPGAAPLLGQGPFRLEVDPTHPMSIKFG
jgi:hypothetical protein